MGMKGGAADLVESAQDAIGVYRRLGACVARGDVAGV